MDVSQNNTLHVANNARVLLVAIEGGLYHTRKMTFPAVRETSSQNIILGLAQKATGSARLDKIYIIVGSVLLEVGDVSELVFLNIHWPLGNKNLLVTCHRQSCAFQAILYSRSCLDFVRIVAESNSGGLFGECRSKLQKVMFLDICKI